MPLIANTIDLHTHSTASDGTDTPAQLVQKAENLGLAAIALTDHDTIEGLDEAVGAGDSFGIEVVPGLELSIEDVGDRRFHLLSYFFDREDPELTRVLESVRRWRWDRNEIMIDRAKKAGIGLTIEEVREEAGPDATVIGRPHFASALVKKGLASSIQDAFDKYLATDRPLHEPKPSLSPLEAARLIHGAGGITVLAHPGLIKWADQQQLTEYVASLKALDALDGIECYYFRYDEAQTQFFLGLAKELSLCVSGGSDYHGDNKPDVPLGDIYHGKALATAMLDPLREAAARRREARSAGS